MLLTFLQIPQLNEEKSLILAIHTFTSYIMIKLWEIKIFVVKKIMISPILIDVFVELDRALLYIPRIGLKVKVWFLEQKVCSTTPIKIKSIVRIPKNLGVKRR